AKAAHKKTGPVIRAPPVSTPTWAQGGGSPAGPRALRLLLLILVRAQSHGDVPRDRIPAGSPRGADDVQDDQAALLHLRQLAPVLADRLHGRPVQLGDHVPLAQPLL